MLIDDRDPVLYCKECGAIEPDTEYIECSAPSHVSDESVMFEYWRESVSFCCGSTVGTESDSACVVTCPSCDTMSHAYVEKETCVKCDWVKCPDCLMTRDPAEEDCPCGD